MFKTNASLNGALCFSMRISLIYQAALWSPSLFIGHLSKGFAYRTLCDPNFTICTVRFTGSASKTLSTKAGERKCADLATQVALKTPELPAFLCRNRLDFFRLVEANFEHQGTLFSQVTAALGEQNA